MDDARPAVCLLIALTACGGVSQDPAIASPRMSERASPTATASLPDFTAEPVADEVYREPIPQDWKLYLRADRVR